MHITLLYFKAVFNVGHLVLDFFLNCVNLLKLHLKAVTGIQNIILLNYMLNRQLHDKFLRTCFVFKSLHSFLVYLFMAEFWGPGQCLTHWHWHCTCGSSDDRHMHYFPSEQVQPKLKREVDDVVWQNKRAFPSVFHTFSTNQELPCLETQCPLNNSMQWQGHQIK